MRIFIADNKFSVMRAMSGSSQPASAYLPFGYSRDVSGCLPGFNGEKIEVFDGYLLGHGYRAYSTILNRFTCPDSLSPFHGGGLNCYSYCNGDPVNRADPTGHISMFRKLLGSPKLLGIAAGGFGLAAGATAAAYFASGGSGDEQKGLLYSAIALGLSSAGLGGFAVRAKFAKSRIASFKPPKNPVLLGYHGTAEGEKLSRTGFFRPGEVYLTDSLESARHYAGSKGRVFGAYVNESDLPMMSARYAPKSNMASGVTEMPLNIHAKKLVRAREVASGPPVDLHGNFNSFGRTHDQYHRELIRKMGLLRA